MELRTEIKPVSFRRKIELTVPLLTMGSCFADSIGALFQVNKFNVLANPFGSTYHPNAIHSTLKSAIHQAPPEAGSLVERDGLHYHFQFHSRFSGKTEAELFNQIEKSVNEVHLFLKNCRILLVTYGTAWIYERKDTGKSVANCHKMPGGIFSKRLTPVEEIVQSFSEVLAEIKQQFPSIQVILTISPVRHVKDGLEGNSISKAVLRNACHRIVSENNDVLYFPAFEIMMDDLRDYRFYKDDLIHPTATAENYIWEKFCQVALAPEALAFISRWNEIRQSLDHRAFNPRSPGHQDFLKQTLKKLEELSPMVNVTQEMAAIREQIHSIHP